MATSHTKRKRSRKSHASRPLLNDPQINSAITHAVKFLHSWTQRELHKISTVGNVLILPGKTKNHYNIGKYQLHKQNEHCWTVSTDDKKIQDFYDRRSALFYCMSTHCRYSKQAEYILMQDALVGKLYQDLSLYQHSITVARKNKNWVLHDTVQARISEISSKLDYAQEQLEKSLRWAKYMKTQDDSHETTRIRN